jgi:hypothetical protein
MRDFVACSSLTLLHHALLASGCKVAPSSQEAAARTHEVAPSPEGESLPHGGTTPTSGLFLEVSYRFFASCLATSDIEDPSALGGFGSVDNRSRAISAVPAGAHGSIFLHVQPEVAATIPSGHQAVRLVLGNATLDVHPFNATDSQLEIVQEALATDGCHCRGESTQLSPEPDPALTNVELQADEYATGLFAAKRPP